jgi:hypothetical protein
VHRNPEKTHKRRETAETEQTIISTDTAGNVEGG